MSVKMHSIIVKVIPEEEILLCLERKVDKSRPYGKKYPDTVEPLLTHTLLSQPKVMGFEGLWALREGDVIT